MRLNNGVFYCHRNRNPKAGYRLLPAMLIRGSVIFSILKKAFIALAFLLFFDEEINNTMPPTIQAPPTV